MKIKTFFNTIFILIIIGFLGFVFWLGLEQIDLEENTYGIVYTKTSGWRDQAVTHEGFKWSFEKVIPTVYTMHKFTINNRELSLESIAYLPSYELYAKSSSIKPDNFIYKYKLSGTYRLDHSYLPKLTSNGTVTTDNFDNWESRSEEEIKSIIESFIQSKVNSLNFNEDSITSDIFNLLEKAIPHYKFNDLHLNLIVPDMTLYNTSRERYITMLKAETKAEEDFIEEKLKQQNDEILKLELLKKYGEVFTKYPIMIEYLKVDSDKMLNRANLQDFIATQNRN